MLIHSEPFLLIHSEPFLLIHSEPFLLMHSEPFQDEPKFFRYRRWTLIIEANGTVEIIRNSFPSTFDPVL